MPHSRNLPPISGSSPTFDQDRFWDRLMAGAKGIPFEDFQVQGVIRRGHIIPVPDDQAEYWTIIGTIGGEQVCGIGCFDSREDAENEARGFLKSPPTKA